MIRGKGATKQGKYNPLGIPQPGEDEELHALISAVSPEDLKVGMDKVRQLGLTTCACTVYLHVMHA